jgi:hypothetical protein
MQPSGEIRRFEVDDRPIDRRRRLIGSVALTMVHAFTGNYDI